MKYDVRVVSTYPPRVCGIGTFTRNLITSLCHLTGEVGAARVAAIDKGKLLYWSPIDLVIEQYDQKSWRRATSSMLARADETENPTIFLLQHEYGLDPDTDGKDCMGTNYVDMAEDIRARRGFREGKFITMTQLHTVLKDPNEHQRKTLQQLAEYSDGLIVTARRGVDILTSDVYGIDQLKVRHIPHGIRMQDCSEHDRLEVKKEFGWEDMMLLTTLGLRSIDKGIQYGILAYAKVMEESFTKEQIRNTLYLIAGQCHPDLSQGDGKLLKEYEKMMEGVLADSGLKHIKVHNLSELKKLDCRKYDIVFFDAFLEDEVLLKMYTATNMMLYPSLGEQQISSGILADTVGSGRVAIAGKSVYSVELLHANHTDLYAKGIIGIGDPHARGILVDPGKESIDQVAEAIHFLTSREEMRLAMEKRARSVGHSMSWQNVVTDLVQYVDWLREDKQKVTGRGPKFELKTSSRFEARVKETLDNQNHPNGGS